MPDKPWSLGVVADFPEEGWESMRLCAEMLLEHFGEASRGAAMATNVTPTFRRTFSSLPWPYLARRANNADRMWNRFVTLPRAARGLAGRFDLFHVVDHSYSQVVQSLPRDRVGVYCHDLDTFRCLLDAKSEPRPWWFRQMARRILSGLEKAAVIFHTTREVGRRLASHGIAPPERLVHAPNGVSREFFVATESVPMEHVGDRPDPYILHVGTCIDRKRVDVLLDVFAELRRGRRELKLVQIGGEWTAAQRTRIDHLGIAAHVRQLRGLDRAALAQYYRHAKLTLLPSEAEGFGLPVIEALACGQVVIASDIATLREVGGDAVVYRAVGEVAEWTAAADKLLSCDLQAPSLEARRAQAERYTWRAQAETIHRAYESLLAGQPLPRAGAA